MGRIRFETTDIMGLVKIIAPTSHDRRGSFGKTFVASDYAAQGLPTVYAEEYHTVSKQGTVRGMHFQLPPDDLAKTVFCVAGTVYDVVLDLRRGSPTYSVARTFDLVESGFGLHIPSGCAHGFAVLTTSACLAYKVTSAYSAENDAGVLWSSIAVDWPFGHPILSVRDARFAPLDEFVSPFVYPVSELAP